jgi:hypothetical protein
VVGRIDFPTAFQNLLAATAESIISIGAHRVSEDFINTITKMLPRHELEELRSIPVIAELALMTLLKFNTAAIPRKSREAVLDHLSDLFSRQSAVDDGDEHTEDLIGSGINEANKDKVIALMLQLLSTSTPTAKVVGSSCLRFHAIPLTIRSALTLTSSGISHTALILIVWVLHQKPLWTLSRHYSIRSSSKP